MAAPRKRPPAFRHGLFSQVAREERRPEVRDLAEALSGPLWDEPRVRDAALEASEAIIWHRHIQRYRIETLERAALLRANRTPEERGSALKLAAKVKVAPASACAPLIDEVRGAHEKAWLPGFVTGCDHFLGIELERHAAELRRVAGYERKAVSRRRTTIRRLDYERIEAERRAARARPAGSGGAPLD